MWKRYVEEMIAFLQVLLLLLLLLQRPSPSPSPSPFPSPSSSSFSLPLSCTPPPLTGSAKVQRSGASAVQRVEEEIPNGPWCSPPCPRGGQGKSLTTRVCLLALFTLPLVAGGAASPKAHTYTRVHTHIHTYTHTHTHVLTQCPCISLFLSLSDTHTHTHTHIYTHAHLHIHASTHTRKGGAVSSKALDARGSDAVRGGAVQRAFQYNGCAAVLHGRARLYPPLRGGVAMCGVQYGGPRLEYARGG